MATFFDTSAQADLDLLHSSIRDDSELDNVVDSVEWSIIHFYSEKPSLPLLLETGKENLTSVADLTVRLDGYDEDTPADSDDDLKEALKRTIADVVSFKLRNYNNDSNAQSISQGKRSITYWSRQVGWDSFPDGWRWRLGVFDQREGLWHI